MLPKVNQQLFFQIESFDEEEAKQVFKSRIADIQEGYLAIEVPINEKTGKLKRLYENDHLTAHYISQDGVKHFFNTKVIGFKTDNIRQIMIKSPDPDAITKVQRRNYLRVPAELEVAVQLSKHIRFLAVTEDIGGGGLSFICDSKYPLQEQEEISCWLLLHFRNNSIDHVFYTGKIIRIKKLETGRQLVMLSFSDIHNVDRQKIIRYCFERQLELRK